jgi:hypothetical protein
MSPDMPQARTLAFNTTKAGAFAERGTKQSGNVLPVHLDTCIPRDELSANYFLTMPKRTWDE